MRHIGIGQFTQRAVFDCCCGASSKGCTSCNGEEGEREGTTRARHLHRKPPTRARFLPAVCASCAQLPSAQPDISTTGQHNQSAQTLLHRQKASGGCHTHTRPPTFGSSSILAVSYSPK